MEQHFGFIVSSILNTLKYQPQKSLYCKRCLFSRQETQRQLARLLFEFAAICTPFINCTSQPLKVFVIVSINLGSQPAP
jgi:hypothetical protein